MGGIQRYSLELIKRLSRHVELAVVVPPGSQSAVPATAVVAVEIGLRQANTSPAFANASARLARVIQQFGPDVVHFGSAGLAVYKNAVPAGISVMVTVHGKDLALPWQLTPDDTSRRIVEGLSTCDAVGAMSDYTAAYVRGVAPAARVVRLMPGCDIERFRPNSSSERTVGMPFPTVLTVSRIIRRKGHLELLSGLELASTTPHWLIAGDGPAIEELSGAVSRSSLASRTRLLGHTRESDLDVLYASCDIFALTPINLPTEGGTDWEGFGLVYHEAGASGKAVVASNHAGPSEAVLNRRTGFLVSPHQPREIADAVDTLLRCSATRTAFGAAGRRHVESIGGWEHAAAHTAAIYANLIGWPGQA